MERPLDLVTRGVSLTPPLEQAIRSRAGRLERFYPRLVGCSIVVEGPGERHQAGGPYEVRLDLRVPGAEPILVSRQSQERLERAIDDAFDVATRRLQDLVRLQRSHVKHHEEAQARARIVRLFPEAGYGFLETADGREIYFHRNSVLGAFEALSPGTEVRFHEEAGDEGPQASTVSVV
jgi:cold shock CspA family protein/ribosome-associated translation inhibitor RaiA